MGKKQHQQDKLYLTTTEWKNFYGGKKEETPLTKASENFKRLPFYCCALTFHECQHPYCTQEGIIFDLENIVPFIRKYGKNPVNGEKLEAKSLIKIQFSKNSKNEYHCPVTYKIFNENSHIVAIRTTGNVFSYDAIEELNLKVNYLKDLLTDEPFTKKDILTIQDPTNLEKFNMTNYHHLKLKLKWVDDDTEARKDPQYYLKTMTTEARETLNELNKQSFKSDVSVRVDDEIADEVNAALYSTGRVSSSLTSTVAPIAYKQQAARLDDCEIRWQRLIGSGKKGYVCLVTNLGRLNIELFCDQVPKTCENFMKHCLTKYYKDTKFHRNIPDFMIQGGDPTGTGTGGQSIWKEAFEDEFLHHLSHDSRGILSMANSGPNTNKSQFFITYRPCKQLNKVHTVFGKVVGGLDVLNKMERSETYATDRPKKDIIIEDCLVFVDPYDEIDKQLVEEREKAKNKHLDAKKPQEKPKNPLDLKAQHTGIGKYIQTNTL